MINNHIDFDNPNVSRFLGFEDSALIKRTPEGLEFKTYIGYYYYLITGSVGHEFLKGTTKQDFAIRDYITTKTFPILMKSLAKCWNIILEIVKNLWKDLPSRRMFLFLGILKEN